MADSDNLDTLSNAELRAQMVAQGLPNIPVTDSSRKVLVKRLRASLGGNAASPAAAASPKKASSRRETLQPASQVDKVDSQVPSKGARRTIASALNETEERQPSKPVATVAAAPKAAAPIQSRRASNTERREVVNVVKKPETIAEETAPKAATKVAPKEAPRAVPREAPRAAPQIAPQQRKVENTLEVNSLIILESDEEEDEQLALAAQSAEDQYKLKPIKPKPLTATATATHSYVSKPLYQLPDPPVLEPQSRPVLEQPQRPVQLTRANLPSSSSYEYGSSSGTATGISGRSGRYTSYTTSSTALPSYITSSSATAAASSAAPSSSYQRRSPPRTYANEFSDDTADDDAADSVPLSNKFESDFARKLAKLRAERIGDRSSPYNRRTIATSGSNYEPVARRSLRPENSNNVSVAFRRWIISLDRKYNLKAKLFILFVLLLIYFVYKINY